MAFLLLTPNSLSRVACASVLESNSPRKAGSISDASSEKRAMLVKSLAIEPRTLEKRPDRLLEVSRRSEKLVSRNSVSGPFSDYADYSARALSSEIMKVRCYKIAGHKDVEIVLPEEYARKLDTLEANDANDAQDAKGARDTNDAQDAKDLAKRVCPSDIPQLLDAMPDSAYFKRVFLSANSNPEDDWVTQTYYPEGFISSMAMTDGQLELFRAERSEYLRRDVLHEWSHQMRYKFWHDKLMQCFEAAVNLELVEWNPSLYSTRSAGEQWAVLGERMLGESSEDFLEACENAPVRTTLWMRALYRCLASVARANQSVDHEKYLQRVSYVEKNVLPKAVKKMEVWQHSGKTQFLRRQAREVLHYLKATDWTCLSKNLALVLCLHTYASRLPLKA
jgi:hypothetical protein